MKAQQTFQKVGVLDVGAGESSDDRADTTLDIREVSGPDIQHDITETPWPIADSAATTTILSHVIEHVADPTVVMHEAARVTAPSGTVEVTIPVGRLRWIDPTHRRHWSWRTPEYFCRRCSTETYSYNPGPPPLRLVNRSLPSLWIDAPALCKASPAVRAVANIAPEAVLQMTPAIAGELRAVYRVEGEEFCTDDAPEAGAEAPNGGEN